jgi:hypothetical protein
MEGWAGEPHWDEELERVAPALSASLAQHAAGCPPCAGFLRARQAGPGHVRMTLPPHVRDRVAAALQHLMAGRDPAGPRPEPTSPGGGPAHLAEEETR